MRQDYENAVLINQQLKKDLEILAKSNRAKPQTGEKKDLAT